MNIQKKIILTFSLLSLISISMLAFLAINNSKSSIQFEVENSLNGIVDEKVKAIKNYIKHEQDTISTYSKLPVISRAMSDYATSFEKGVDSNNYKDTDSGYRKILSMLKRRAKNYDLFLISTQGIIVYSDLHEEDFAKSLLTGPFKSSQLAERFKMALQGSKITMSKFLAYSPSQSNIDEDTLALLTEHNNLTSSTNQGVGLQSHSAFVAAPIFHNKKIIGVVAMQINSDDYFHLSTDYRALKQTGEVVITQLLNGYAVVVSPLRRRNNAEFNLRFKMGSKQAIPIQQSLLGGSGSGVSIGYDGSKIIAAWRYVAELEWGVVVKMEAGEAFHSAEKLQYNFIFIGVIIFSITIGFGWILSFQLSKPILALVKFTNKVASGDFSQKITIESNDEIGMLADSFNHMLVAKKADDLLIKNSEKNIKQSLVKVERYKFAMDEHAIVSSSDVKGNINYVNQKFIEVSGYSYNELIKKNHRIVNSNYHHKRFFTSMYKTISSGKVWKGDIRNQKKDGSYYWVSTTIVPFLNEHKKPIMYMAMRSEITENINNANRLALAKDQLVEKVDKLSQVNEELDQFAYVASHDLKSPLNGINQLVSWIEEDCNELLPDDSKEHLVLLKSRSKRMMNLLNDLLDYSRVGRQQHEIECFSLSDMVNDIFELQGQSDRFKCVSSDVVISLQKTPFEMVIRNLISNAIKHHDKATGNISVTATDEGHFYTFIIEDDGPGIPEELHEKALEMFQTLQSRDKIEGSGMGLAIVKKMVEHHRGSLEITAKTGRGSVFIVKWPIG